MKKGSKCIISLDIGLEKRTTKSKDYDIEKYILFIYWKFWKVFWQESLDGIELSKYEFGYESSNDVYQLFARNLQTAQGTITIIGPANISGKVIG